MAARILVVEDNPDNLRLVSVLLGAYGHTPLGTSSGAEAIEILRRERPDLILLDIQMPEMDGYATLRAIRTGLGIEDVPIVALTALAMPKDVEAGLRAGFDAYITKPLDPFTLDSTLNEFLPPELRSTRPVARPDERAR